MTDSQKDDTNNIHRNIGKLVQIGKVEGNVTIQNSLETNAQCPVCERNDRVQKVSAILAKEIHNMNGVTIERQPLLGTQSSDLALKLKAPAQPQAKGKPSRAWRLRYISGFLAWMTFGGSILLLLIYILTRLGLFPTGNSGISESYIWSLICAGNIVYGLPFLVIQMKYHQKKKVYEQEVNRVQATEYPKWQKAMERWGKLYYCDRNYCVFIPGENTFAELDSINEYVYHLT